MNLRLCIKDTRILVFDLMDTELEILKNFIFLSINLVHYMHAQTILTYRVYSDSRRLDTAICTFTL